MSFDPVTFFERMEKGRAEAQEEFKNADDTIVKMIHLNKAMVFNEIMGAILDSSDSGTQLELQRRYEEGKYQVDFP